MTSNQRGIMWQRSMLQSITVREHAASALSWESSLCGNYAGESSRYSPRSNTTQALRSKGEQARPLSDSRYLARGFLTLTVEQDAKDSEKQLSTVRQAGLTLPAPDYYLSGDAGRRPPCPTTGSISS